MAGNLRFYADEHVARAVVRGLRLRGIDVKTAHEAGLGTAGDEDHVEFARREGRVIVTQDADFLRLHAQGVPHPGLVYAPQGTSISRLIQGLLLIHGVLSSEEMKGHVEFI